MFINYIASKVDYKDLGDGKLEIDGKVYFADETRDPEYQDDGVLDISYFPIYDGEDNLTNMVLAFDRNDVAEENANEWGDMYNNPHVLIFK